MVNLTEGDRISINGLATIVTGFTTIGDSEMVCTPYGDFNVSIVKRIRVAGPKNPMAIKVYSDNDYDLIYTLANRGRTMDQIARHLGIGFRRFWIDYNNPALDVKANYEAGRDELDQKSFADLQYASTDPKNGKALVAFHNKLSEINLRNKLREIQEQNNIWG